MAGWREEDHPRDPKNGEFVDAGGGGGGKDPLTTRREASRAFDGAIAKRTAARRALEVAKRGGSDTPEVQRARATLERSEIGVTSAAKAFKEARAAHLATKPAPPAPTGGGEMMPRGKGSSRPTVNAHKGSNPSWQPNRPVDPKRIAETMPVRQTKPRRAAPEWMRILKSGTPAITSSQRRPEQTARVRNPFGTKKR